MGALLGLVHLSIVGGSAWASPEQDDSAPISLRVSPAVLEVPHQPAGAEDVLRVENTGSQPLRVTTDVTEFTVAADGSTTLFRGAESLSAASWVSIDTTSFDLSPGQRREVSVTVDVPPDAEPGERYVSVVFAIPPEDPEGNITVTHRVAAKLYVDVPGERVERLELGALTGPRLIDSTQTGRFRLAVHNHGNVHRRFEGPTQLVATSGDHSFTFQNFTVLADSTRRVEGVWRDPPVFCVCTVEVATDDGRGNPLVVSAQVIVLPWRLGLALLTAAVGATMLLAVRRHRHAVSRGRHTARGAPSHSTSVSATRLLG